MSPDEPQGPQELRDGDGVDASEHVPWLVLEPCDNTVGNPENHQNHETNIKYTDTKYEMSACKCYEV